MIKNCKYFPLIFCAVVSWQTASAENMLKNPGFEQQKSDWNLFYKSPGSFAVLSGAKQAYSGSACAEIKTGEDPSGWHITLRASPLDVAPGGRYRYTMRARGKGRLELMCLESGMRNDKDCNEQKRQAAPLELNGDWQEATFDYVAGDGMVRAMPCVTLYGKDSAAFLDDGVFEPIPMAGRELKPLQLLPVTYPGGVLVVPLELAGFDEKTGQGTLKISVVKAGGDFDKITKIQTAEATLDKNGRVNYQLKILDDELGYYRFKVAHPSTGAQCQFYYELLDKPTYDKFAALVAKVNIDMPARLVFEGDSLTDDYGKPFNYVHKIYQWLKYKYGDKVTMANGGVGGSTIKGALERLQGQAKHRGMEGNIITQNPTHVFLFFGHNDSKLSYMPELKGNFLPLNEFEEDYRTVIKTVREQTKAKIYIISTTSSVQEICKANWEKYLKQNGKASYFGKSEELEKYNAVAKKLAREFNLPFIDVYEPTKNYPDKPRLFKPTDGVHLNNEGNNFIALELLSFFAGANPKAPPAK